MTSAVLGAGTLFKLGDSASPIVYTTIGEVVNIGPIGSTAELVEVTNMDSGNDKEYIAGLQDGDEVEIEFNWTKGTQQVALRAAQNTTVPIQVTWPDSPATTATFSYVVLKFGINPTTPGEAVTASVSGKITGTITWA